VLIDGHVVLDGITETPPRGDAFFGLGSIELDAEVELTQGQTVEVVVEFSAGSGTGIRGVAVGHQPPVPADLVERAARAAAAADVAVVIVGTSSEWETEGYDRESIDLPGDQDALVRAVCAANRRTVVVVNAGSPIDMPWASLPAATVVSWLGGQEMSEALADVIFGDAEPGGRLPVTFPLTIEHTPGFGNFPGESNETRYTEGLLIGHRWYDTRRLPVRYPFGHGLSYTQFSWGAPRVVRQGPAACTVEIDVVNTGARAGSDVVQLYVAPASSAFERPAHQLVGVAKAHLEPGQATTVRIECGPRSFAYWNPANTEHLSLRSAMGGAAESVPAGGGVAAEVDQAGWYIDAGEHTLCVARSIADIVATMPFAIAEPTGPLQGEDSLPV
jgi:beta-glucosidase